MTPKEKRQALLRHRVTQLIHLCLWLTPAFLLTASVLISQHSTLPSISLWFQVPVLILVTISCGVFDSLLSPDLPTNNGTPDRSSLIAHSLEFCAVQLAFAPVASIGLGILLSLALFFG